MGRFTRPGYLAGWIVDRFGPRLAHLNTMLAVLRPLAASIRKPES